MKLSIGAILEAKDPTLIERLNPPHVHIFIPISKSNESNCPIAMDAYGRSAYLLPGASLPLIYAFESAPIVHRAIRDYGIASLVVTAPHVD